MNGSVVSACAGRPQSDQTLLEEGLSVKMAVPQRTSRSRKSFEFYGLTPGEMWQRFGRAVLLPGSIKEKEKKYMHVFSRAKGQLSNTDRGVLI